MPKKLQPREILDFLERYDAGTGIETIAKAVKKDPRVVRKHIEAAMRQRDLKAAQRRLLENSLYKHQEDLMAVIKDLGNVLQVPPLDTVVGLKNKGDILELPHSRAYMGADEYTGLKFEAESRRTWELLREHIPRDPLWNTVDNWRVGVLKDINVRQKLWRSIAKRAEEELGHKIQEPTGAPPYLTSYCPQLIYEHVLYELVGMGSKPIDPEKFREEADGSVKYLGRLIARLRGSSKEFIKKFIRLFDEPEKWDQSEELRRCYSEAGQLTRKGFRVVEELQLLHFIPGQCAICRRLGP